MREPWICWKCGVVTDAEELDTKIDRDYINVGCGPGLCVREDELVACPHCGETEKIEELGEATPGEMRELCEGYYKLLTTEQGQAAERAEGVKDSPFNAHYALYQDGKLVELWGLIEEGEPGEPFWRIK